MIFEMFTWLFEIIEANGFEVWN